MSLQIIRNDITKMKVDAIVNAANTGLKMGGGVCGAIFKAAGAKDLQKECDSIGKCNTGEAVITKGYNLPAKYIIHTPGPIWNGENKSDELLKNCYLNSLKLAKEHNIESIAFPLISSGIYGYPKELAFKIAVLAIQEFLFKNDMEVYLIVFDKSAVEISEKLFSGIEKYIDDNYIDERHDNNRAVEFNMPRFIETKEDRYDFTVQDMIAPVKGKRKLEDVVKNLDETFSEMLLRLIDEKNRTDVDTYKRANIDRKLFSKIRTDKYYKPKKSTALALAISLELNIDETKDLLAKAGYALSHSSKFDIIVEYFIMEEIYNIFDINEALFTFDENLLGV